MQTQSMPSDMCVAAMGPPPHVCTNQQDIVLVGVTRPAIEFVEVIAWQLQKRKVQVARHLRVCVEAH